MDLRSPLLATRRFIHRRADSSSSRASRVSSDSDEPFAFSPANTPSEETPPFRTSNPRYAMDSSAPGKRLPGKGTPSCLPGWTVCGNPQGEVEDNARDVASDLALSPSSKTRPIDIELPKRRRPDPNSTSTFTPPAPLSARGDISGAYFPLHEDPASRIRAPHPFQADTEMARRSSLQRAAELGRCDTGARSSGRQNASPTSQYPGMKPTSASASPYTPISSYIPSGLHDDVVLPMGKYYPSNWEKRHGKKSHLQPSTTAKPAAPVVTKSEPQVPRPHDEHRHARPDLDVKRRLQQYQRDMVAQAAMAASAVLAKSQSMAGSARASSRGGGTLPTAQFAAAFLKAHKPLSPRLQPVGSPGVPITPMSLEDESYLTLGSPATGMAAQPQTTEAGDAMRPGEKKRQRNKSRSPSIGLSAVSV
ncbi:uncharacterized protein B0T15DRAFT_482526 [Chaetomium strumarium]|uniref:Uncharacterized protein n=1 Tax=Chaetomium strumarium TaxID=1170767 RepID=A0AAJ0M747_9PEZI|nr:hypothetical protein B0T15DRAFT_482526 [Chaetomium strumarium]